MTVSSPHFDLRSNSSKFLALLGGSGSGKAVFTGIFEECLPQGSVLHIESGALFRKALEKNPELRRDVNAGKVIATLDPISELLTAGYSQAIELQSRGGYVIQDGVHRRPEQVDVEAPFCLADAALQRARSTTVYDSRTFYQQRLIDEANQATRNMRCVLMEADPNMCFQLMQVRFATELQKAKGRNKAFQNPQVEGLLTNLTHLYEHNLELARNKLQGGDLKLWTTGAIADFVRQAASDEGLQDPETWSDPSRLLNTLMPVSEDPVKVRMDDIIPKSAIARTTNCIIPPSVEGGKWTLGPVGETAKTIGYTFDDVSGTFGVPPALSGRLAIVHNPGLVEGGYAQLQENCRNQAMRWIEEDRREGIEGEMTMSAAMRR